MKAARFMRKPFPVRGFEVTETNMDAIARWCVGHVVREDVPRPFVRVPVSRSVNEKQTRAYVRTWVIAADGKRWMVAKRIATRREADAIGDWLTEKARATLLPIEQPVRQK